jgi:hypothetical protein
MDRLKLWGYKKLANENVREEKVIDDADYNNSCFQLKKSLKVRNLILLELDLTMQQMHE